MKGRMILVKKVTYHHLYQMPTLAHRVLQQEMSFVGS